MVIGSLLFVLAVCCISAGLAALGRKPIGYMFLPGICFAGILCSVLYSAGLFGKSVWIIAGVGVIGLAATVWRCLREKVVRDFVLNSDLLFFAVGSLLFIILNYGRVYALNDEFSHWGLAIKNMFETGEYYASGLSNDLFKSYPPFATAVCTLAAEFTKPFTGGFCESATFVGMDILLLGCLMPFVSLITEKMKSSLQDKSLAYWCLPGVGVILALTVMCFKFSAFTIVSVDTLLALLTAAMVANYFSKGSFQNLPIIAMALTMTKDIGIGFAIFGATLCFADLLYKKSKRITDNKAFIKNSVFFGCTLLFSALAKVYCRAAYINGGAVVSEKGNTSGGFSSIMKNGLSPVQQNVFKAFCKAFIQPKMSVGVPLLATAILLTVLSIILIIYIRKTYGAQKSAGCVILFTNIFFGFWLYSLGVLISYWTSFTEYEALQMASFERYFGTYMTLWLLLLVGGLVATAGVRLMKTFENKKIFWKSAVKVLSVSAGALIIIFFAVFYPYTASKARAFRDKYKDSEIIGEYYHQGIIKADDTVLFIPDGDYENIDRLMANYNGAPVSVVYEKNWQAALNKGKYRYAFKDGELFSLSSEGGEVVFTALKKIN